MSQSHQITVTSINTTETASTTATPVKSHPTTVTSRDSVKDAGRVHVGGGMMRF